MMQLFRYILILSFLLALFAPDVYAQEKKTGKEKREQRRKEKAIADSIALQSVIRMIEGQEFMFEAIREISNQSDGYKAVDNSLFIAVRGKEMVLKYKAVNQVGDTEIKDEEYWGSITNYEFLRKKNEGEYRLSISVVFSKGKLDMRFETSKADITYLIIDKEFVFTELGDNYEGRIVPLRE